MAGVRDEDLDRLSNEDANIDNYNNGEFYRERDDTELDFVLRILNEEEKKEYFLGISTKYNRECEYYKDSMTLYVREPLAEGDTSLEFSARPGPRRVLDGGDSAVNSFQFFFLRTIYLTKFVKGLVSMSFNAQEKINHDF